jgi:hypothetical protein
MSCGCNKKQNGGTAYPLQYYGTSAEVSASEGVDLLPVSGHREVRPAIGGKRRKHRKHRSQKHRSQKHRSQKHRKVTRRRGGFYPSVMGNFIPAAAKYVTPIAMFSAYKLMKKSAKYKGGRRTKSLRTRKHRR